MSFFRCKSFMRFACIQGCAAILIAGQRMHKQQFRTIQFAIQFVRGLSSESTTQEFAEAAVPGSPAALPCASTIGVIAAQEESGGSGLHPHAMLHNLTFEAGGGFNAPVGNDTPYITWGGNFTLGAGVRFSNRIWPAGIPVHGQQPPGAFEAACMASRRVTPHQFSDYRLSRHRSHSKMVEWRLRRWRSVTITNRSNLQDYEEVESFYGVYDEPVTVASVTSNQWGWKWRPRHLSPRGGMYGDGKSQVFLEARYTFIHTPPATQTNGFGTTELIPRHTRLPILEDQTTILLRATTQPDRSGCLRSSTSKACCLRAARERKPAVGTARRNAVTASQRLKVATIRGTHRTAAANLYRVPTSPCLDAAQEIHRASLRSPGLAFAVTRHRSRNSSHRALRRSCWSERMFCSATASSRRRAASCQTFSSSSPVTASEKSPRWLRAHTRRGSAAAAHWKARLARVELLGIHCTVAGPYTSRPPHSGFKAHFCRMAASTSSAV